MQCRCSHAHDDEAKSFTAERLVELREQRRHASASYRERILRARMRVQKSPNMHEAH
jgi:hypothetical protein